MLHIVIANWSAQSAYFGPFSEKEEADEYRTYLLRGMPSFQEEYYVVVPLTPPQQDYKMEKISKGIVKGSKTAISLLKTTVGQEFMYYNTRFVRIHASTPDNERVMIEQNGVIPVQCLEGPDKGRCSGIPKEYLVEPIQTAAVLPAE